MRSGALKDYTMTQPRNSQFKIQKIGYGSLLIAVLLLAAVTLALSADDGKVKVGTIDATAMGTSTQLGQTISVKINIYQFSTEEDRAILVEAYKKGQNQGLGNALTKMKADGHIAITGTIAYHLSFIRLIPTPTARKARNTTLPQAKSRSTIPTRTKAVVFSIRRPS